MSKKIDLNEVARLIILQIDHNRECGKDDGYTMEEVAGIIEKRVLGDKRKAIIKPVFMYSREPFEGWTNRFVMQMIIDNAVHNDISITIYSNDNSYVHVLEYLIERTSSKVIGFKLVYRATRSQDEAASRLVEEVLSKLPIIGSSY